MLVPQEKEEPMKHRVKHSFADKLGVYVWEYVFISFKVTAQKEYFLNRKDKQRRIKKQNREALYYEEYDKIMLLDILRKYCQ